METIRNVIRTFCLWFFFLQGSPVWGQSICADTIERSRFFLNSDTSIAVYKNFVQESGNSYLTTRSWKSNSTIFNSVVSKKDPQGSVLWSRHLTTTFGDSTLQLLHALEATDQTVYLLGVILQKGLLNASEQPVLLHFDKDGSLIACWRIDLKETSPIQAFSTSILCQIDPSSIGLLISYSSEDYTKSFLVAKLELTAHSFLWATRFHKNNFYSPNALLVDGSELLIPSRFSYPETSSQQRGGINWIKLNALTGALSTSKSYINPFTNKLMGGWEYNFIKARKDGSYQMIHKVSKDDITGQLACIRFNSSLDIAESKLLGPINYEFRNLSINRSGAFALSFFNPSDVSLQGYMAMDGNYRTLQHRKLRPLPGLSFDYAFSNNDLNLSDSGRLTLFVGSKDSKVGFQLIATSVYTRDTGCIGSDTAFASSVEDFPLQPSGWTLDQGGNTLPELHPYDIRILELYFQNQLVCSSVTTFSLGLKDSIIKCNNDSVLLKASPGFSSYDWQPGLFQVKLLDSVIKVFPKVDQMYTLSAQTAWGCVAKDTTEVKAKQSALIDLGRDTSICEGTGWLLDAGSAYKSYLWNDGATTRYKSIDQKGMYFVSATDSNGCVSKDTLQVVSVFPTSEVNIHQKQVVCKGQSDVLSPGNGYLSYLWQDGSTSSNFAVSSEGKYWVKVTDKNYCMGSDSVTITALVSLSSNFIYSDTSLCPSETLVLRPYVSYKRYQWNDGSSLPYLNISSPGMYSLQVEDGNGCLAKKQISVAQKQCPNVIYFPTAFTPNKDGKNDVFKPFVEGYLLKYQLIIYNRWGQKIFYATGPDKGWDGFFNGRLQDNGVFVWQCWYQFSGTEAKVQKGSIVLIK